MKNMKKIFGIIALSAVIAIFITGCPTEDTKEDPALTGTVTISGIAKVGETLIADTSGLNGNGTISYQWKRADAADGAGTDIAGAKTDAYTLAAADLDKYIFVTVTREGYSGSISSESSVKVVAVDIPNLQGTVFITGTPKVGETLTADISELGGSGTVSYQWKRADTSAGAGTNIADATANTYILAAADLDKFITVAVTRDGFAGSKTSDPTTVVVAADAPDLTGTVVINGDVTVGSTLTADIGSLNGTGTPSWQWKRASSTASEGENIADAIAGTYILTDDDLDMFILVSVSREGYAGSIPSAYVGPVVYPPLTGTVSISGTAQVGETLTAVTSGLNGSGAVSYQWKRADTASADGDDIADATAITYVVSKADEGKYISITVTRVGYIGSRTSAATAEVLPPPALSGTVSINGNNWIGGTLTVNVSSLGGSGAITYTWLADEAVIEGAMGNSYAIVKGDHGKDISVKVERENNSGFVTGTCDTIVWGWTVKNLADHANDNDGHYFQRIDKAPLAIDADEKLYFVSDVSGVGTGIVKVDPNNTNNKHAQVLVHRWMDGNDQIGGARYLAIGPDGSGEAVYFTRLWERDAYKYALPVTSGAQVQIVSDMAQIAKTGGWRWDTNNVDWTQALDGAITVDKNGNIYSIDQYHDRILKITSGGIVSTIAGGVEGGYQDGIGSNIKLGYTRGITTDDEGNIYFTQHPYNNQGGIRKIDAITGQSSLFVGGAWGDHDGTGTNVGFKHVGSLTYGKDGNFYVWDNIEEGPVLRKVTPDGVVTTVAGSRNRKGWTNGLALAEASFNEPFGIAAGANGNMYVLDYTDVQIYGWNDNKEGGAGWDWIWVKGYSVRMIYFDNN